MISIMSQLKKDVAIGKVEKIIGEATMKDTIEPFHPPNLKMNILGLLEFSSRPHWNLTRKPVNGRENGEDREKNRPLQKVQVVIGRCTLVTEKDMEITDITLHPILYRGLLKGGSRVDRRQEREEEGQVFRSSRR